MEFWTAQYTVDALKGQLVKAMDWYDMNAFSADYNYSDDERKEMLDEIEELCNELERRA